jgi:gliding motility-associated-like protein
VLNRTLLITSIIRFKDYELRTFTRKKIGLLLVSLGILCTSVTAQNYWVGGAGDWSDSNHWATTDGGQGGIGAPNKSTDAIFTELSGLNDNDVVNIDSIAFVKQLDFSMLKKAVIFKGNSSSNLLITGDVVFSEELVNDFEGYVVMVGSNSSYRMKTFQPGEFAGKNSFIGVYKNKRSAEQLLAITSVTANVTDATCGCNGIIVLTINGGVGPFSYSWFPNVPALNGDGTNTVRDLCPGKYNVIVTDLSDGIPYVESDIEVDGPSPLTIQHLLTDSVNCAGGSDGSISTLVFGGIAPYTIVWSDSGAQSTSTAVGLPVGNYTIQVTDFVGCTAAGGPYTVEEPTALTLSITDTNHISCFEVCDGDATVAAGGGSPGYSYSWYDVPGTPTTAQASALCDGTYHVEVTDSKGCLDTSEVIITEPTELVASIGAFTDVVCFGEGNGTANCVVVGGRTTYTYDWYNIVGNPSLPAVSSLSPGTYNVEVTDGSGCLDTAEVTVIEPTLLTSSITDTIHVLCNSLCTGEIEVTAAGGTLAYTYDWYDAANETTQRVVEMCAGSYNVEIEDGNGCLDTSTVTLSQPLIAITTSITDTTHNLCFSACDGIAIVTPVGGSPSYLYDWYDVPGGDTDSTASNLCIGTYNVKVTDANGCSDTSTILITEPAVLDGTTSLIMVDCKSNCTGEVDLSPIGGTTVYTFDWYDVPSTPTSEDVTGLCAGTYNVEITDANGCLDTITSIITEPDTLVSSILSLLNLTCFGECIGSATVGQTGGTSPFGIDWYDHPTTPTSSTVDSLCAGTYNVEITDSLGCLDTSEVIITQPAAAVSSSITDTIHVLCKNGCSGEAEVTAAGGAGGFIYDWYDAPSTPSVVRALTLCAGTYHVEIEDGNGCLDTSEVIITEPVTAITIAIDDSVNATCSGVCDGLAFATYSGGTGPYGIDWYTSGNQTTDTAFNMCVGTHFVEITDVNGCVDSADILIEEPAPMVITINSATLPTCFGDCDGMMSVTPSGGTAPYLYNWYDVVGAPITPSASGQCAGGYNVEVEDDQGCIDTALVILSEPDSLEHTIDSLTHLLCKNLCAGGASLTPTGGTAGYTVTWYDVPLAPTGDTINTLCAGTWNFELEDANGCLDSGTVTLTEPALELVTSITDTTHNVCFGECNGDATVTAVGGTGLITYDWYNSPDGDIDVQAENLCIGTYNVKVSDANGCLDTSVVAIVEPADMVSTITVASLDCGGISDGSASVSVTGGFAPYTYDWYDAGNQTTDTATALDSGTYHVEITDASGCLDTAEAIIATPAALVASIRNDTLHVDCFGNCNGSATADVVGGTPNYIYSWYDVPGSPTLQTVTGLCAGIYHGEVTDDNGCKDTAEVEITQPILLISSADSLEASCFGVCDGKIWADYSGGVSPYVVDWYNVPATPGTDTVIAVCIGSYAVEITDANGCLDTAFVGVTAPIVVSTSITDTTHNNCSYDCLGEAIVTPVGGLIPYTYDWFDVPGGDLDSTSNNLCVGTFHVEVTDANGCLDTSEVTITSASPLLTTSTDSILTSCLGLSDGSAIVLPSGGVGPYVIDWFENANQITDTITGLASGTYKVEVTDANTCLDTVTATVTDPASLVVTITDTTHVLCFEDSTGEAIVTPAGGTAGYTYNWYDITGGDTDSIASNLPVGTFHVEVIDLNGCLDTGIVTITEAPIVVFGSDSIEATCTGICTGSAIVIPSGGVSPYVYDWYDAGGQTNDTATALCAATYNVEVTDANGCIDTTAIIVTEPITITAIAVDTIPATCNSSSDGGAVVNGVGGTLPYTYSWNDPLGQTTDTMKNVTAGTYKGSITDFNGCTDTIEFLVIEPTPILAVDSSVNLSCNGICDGYISLNVSGGSGPYTHSWSNGTNDTLISGLCDGTYSDTITDATGCVDTFTFVITEPDTLKAPITDTIHVTCSYTSNGQAIVTPTGGTTPYTYDWYDAGNDADSVASGLAPGTYHVEVIDANGCLDTGIAIINPTSEIVMITDSVEATCSGICNGIALVNVTGGTAPYTYDWYDAGNIDNDSIINVCADSFNVAVVDVNGCVDTAYVIVTQPVSVTAGFSDTSDAICYGDNAGWATVDGVGGTSPYTYWWSNGTTNDTATALTAGVYRAAIIDVNGCSDTADITINQPAIWAHIVDSTPASCYTYCDGLVTVTPAGGTGPYTHSWNTGSTNSAIINLCAATYYDTITDSRGCIDTMNVVVSEPDSLEAQPLIINHVLCNGDSTASVRSLAGGGTAPYTYDWGNGQITSNGDTAINIGAGNNQLVLTDNRGCIDTNIYTITEPTIITSSITDTIHASCVCNASATVTSVGGTSPYTFAWNDLGLTTDSTALGLCTGDYEVEITDANGCLDTSLVTIRDTSVFAISITDTIHATCTGICDGSAIVTPSLGKAPYTFSWNDPALTTDSSVTGLCVGNTSVTVSDANGCIRFANVAILEPTAISITPMFISPLCFGDTNGIAWVDVTGGNGPYTHSWDRTSVNDTVYDVGIGTYTDTVSDANGCLDTVPVIVTEPNMLASNIDSLNVNCNGNGDGIAWSIPTGGTTPYTYLWNDITSAITDTVNNLPPGLFKVIVIDNNGCSDTDSANITEPLMLTSSITDTSHVSCLCTGTAIVTPLGGTLPYTYVWSDPSAQTDSLATDLCAGNYNVAVTDGNGCTDTSYVIIRDTSNFNTSIIDTNMVKCNATCDGSAKAFAENGVQPYTFNWSDPLIQTDSLATDLCAGPVTVTISDAIGCTHNLTVTITEPAAIAISFIDTSVSCNISCDGSAEATITGGTGPYSVLWDDTRATDSIYVDSLCAGTYTINVTDSNSCLYASAVVITEPAELVAFIGTSNDVSCFGSNDGGASALGTGGTTPYSYLWNTTDITQSISNLGPGFISVQITDTNGCQNDTNITILEPIVLATSITDTTHVLCGGASTGEAIVSPTGGTAPYSYDWYDAPGTQTDSTATSLPAGTYNVEVIDANGCRETSIVTITEPAVFSASVTNQVATSCLVCDGELAVTPAGGVLPYSYDWYDAPGTPKDSSIIGLCASLYNVLVTDGNGCTQDISTFVVGPGGLTAEIIDSSMTSCFGLCDGEAVAKGVAGTAPYTYTWNDDAITLKDSVNNLCADTFNVVVEDSAGCLAYASLIIKDPTLLVATITDTTATGCDSPCNGDATVSVGGGTAPYSYSWDDWSSQNTPKAVGLCVAQYKATVTDAKGCQDTAIAFVTGPGGLIVSVDSTVNINCNGACDGKIAITAQGGAGGFTYLWTDPAGTTDSVVTGLCAGTFNGQVTDANGCLAFANITITEPAELLVNITDSLDATCNGGNSGWALVSYSGGNAPYSIQWNDGSSQTSDTAKALTAGTYTVTVTDANGCSDQDIITIAQPTIISVSLNSLVHVACTGSCIGKATLSVSGGTVGSGYSYLWSPTGQKNPAATGLCSGMQTYTVTDGMNCSIVDSVEILDLNNFTAVITKTDMNCNANCDGTVLSTPSGGTSPYTHSWTNGDATSSQSGLCAGIYIDTVFDVNGCFFVDSIEVLEPTVFDVAIIDSSNLKCFNVCEGYAVAQGSGGTSPYSYSWYNAPVVQTNDTVLNLCASTYYVLGTDANGCASEDTISLTQPLVISTSIDAQTNVSCNGACNGTTSLSATGGSGILGFSWTDGSVLTTRTDLCASNYVITVTDDSLCTADINLNITEPLVLNAIITDTSHIICANVCDGDAQVGETGGTAPFTYDWYDAGNLTSAKIINKCVGLYHAEVTDANGCIDTAEVQINNSNVLSVSITTTNISCNGLCDGKLLAVPTGGEAPYIYSWNTGSTIDSISGLCQANYFVTVSDNNLCNAVAAANIIEPAKLSSAIIDSAHLDCNGICDGFAQVSPSGGTSPYTYLWNDVSAQTNITATGLCAQTYKVVVTDGNGCLDSSNVFLTEPTLITSSIVETQANCTNTADGSIDISSAGGTGLHIYSWIDSGLYTSTDEDPKGLAIGDYYVTISDSNGCTHLDTALITEVNIVIANAGNDTTICNQGSILLVGTGGASYSWSVGLNSDSILVTPSTTTDYILTVLNNGCSEKDTVTVTVNALPNLTAVTSDNLILEGNSVVLTASGAGIGGIYDWTPPTTLNDPTVYNPTSTPLGTTVYTVSGTDVNGCMDTAQVTITVATSIVFPDGITPNGDGLNDTWVIELIDEFPNNVVQIYNRWGQLVFENRGYLTKWNGLHKGKELPIGTYYFLIDLGDNMPKYTGPITLMR